MRALSTSTDTLGISTPSRWTSFPTPCGSTSIASSSQQSGCVFPSRDHRHCARHTYCLSQRSITNPTSQARSGTFVPYPLGTYGATTSALACGEFPYQSQVWEGFRASFVYFPVGVLFFSLGFYPKGFFLQMGFNEVPCSVFPLLYEVWIRGRG